MREVKKEGGRERARANSSKREEERVSMAWRERGRKGGREGEK